MSRTDITVRATTGTGTAQRIAVSGGWLQIPSAAPGVFRIRPLSGEATASSTQRLADTYQLTLPQLLDGADITLHRQGTPPAAELHLSHTAAQHLAILARAPLPRLTRAPPPPRPQLRRPRHRGGRALEATRGRTARPRLHAVHPPPQSRHHRHRPGSSGTAGPGVPAPPASRSRPTTQLHRPHPRCARTRHRAPRPPAPATAPPCRHRLDRSTRRHPTLVRPPATPRPPLASPPQPAVRGKPPPDQYRQRHPLRS